MLILGLKHSKRGVDYAVVSEGSQFVKGGSVDDNADILQAIEQQTGLKTSDYDFAAIARQDSFDLEGITVKQLPYINALTHVGWANSVELDIKTEEPQYPYLIWLDISDTASLLLVESVDQITSLLQQPDGSFTKLSDQFNAKYKQDLLEAAALGDQYAMKIKRLDADQELKPTAFINQVDSAKYDITPDTSDAVHAELESFLAYDIAAALLDAYCESVIVKLLDQAHAIGIKSIMYSGPLVLNERFRGLLSAQTEELGYELRLPPVDFSENEAFALAVYGAFFQAQK